MFLFVFKVLKKNYHVLRFKNVFTCFTSPHTAKLGLMSLDKSNAIKYMFFCVVNFHDVELDSALWSRDVQLRQSTGSATASWPVRC